ncbi:hypothetical protein [Streptomyces sp. cg36]|uniref:hypothetical protein n=1 Tax=Streptomyces sp. cg36 TaxID=3238798 RepID=UPI0034E2AFEC
MTTTPKESVADGEQLLTFDLARRAVSRNVAGPDEFDRLTAWCSDLVFNILSGHGDGLVHVVASALVTDPDTGHDDRLIAVGHSNIHDGAPVLAVGSEDAVSMALTVAVVSAAVCGQVGGIVARHHATGGGETVRGWRISPGEVVPLKAGEVFSAYCTDALTGEPLSPEPGVEYADGFPVMPR